MRLLRLELTKLFAQKRSYVGWGGLFVVPLLMTLALYLNRHNPHHDNGPGGMISLASHNGLLMLVAAGALVAGALAFGLHSPTLLSGQTVSVAHGLWLTALSYLYVLAGVICVLSLALLFATFTNSSLTAAIGALVVVIVMNILGAFSYFDFLKPYLFTSRVDAWQSLFSQPVEWNPILKGVIVFAIYTVALLVAAWSVFRRKDILV